MESMPPDGDYVWVLIPKSHLREYCRLLQDYSVVIIGLEGLPVATRLATSSPIVKPRLTGGQHVTDSPKNIETTKTVKVAVRTMRHVAPSP